MTPPPRVTVVTGVIGSDVHCIGINIVEYALKEAGYEVVSVGIQSSQEEFIEAAIETDAAVILVSSVYGHAQMDCRGMYERCLEAGLDHVLLYVGGNLAVRSDAPWEETYAAMKALGFHRVYPPRSSMSEMLEDLSTDLAARLPVPVPAAAPPRLEELPHHD
jgi:methylaspartate mutase sigma subunit